MYSMSVSCLTPGTSFNQSQEMMRNVGGYRYTEELLIFFTPKSALDRQLLNIENIPGGFNALSSMYHDIQGPLSEVRDDEPSTGANTQQTPAYTSRVTYLSSDDRRSEPTLCVNAWGTAIF